MDRQHDRIVGETVEAWRPFSQQIRRYTVSRVPPDVVVQGDIRWPLPYPILSSSTQPTMITVTFTEAQLDAFTEALDRAVDCPFMDDDNSTDLVLNELVGKLQGAATAARLAAWVQSICPTCPTN